MKIQFVCNGNTFRSRLAEAYFKSRNIPGIEVSSSGVHATKNLNGKVCDYTVEVLKKDGILRYMKKNWAVTDETELEKQDLIVFIGKDNYEDSINMLEQKPENCVIWSIGDIPEYLLDAKPRDIEEILIFAEKAYEQIKENVDQLVSDKIKTGFPLSL